MQGDHKAAYRTQVCHKSAPSQGTEAFGAVGEDKMVLVKRLALNGCYVIPFGLAEGQPVNAMAACGQLKGERIQQGCLTATVIAHDGGAAYHR